VIQQAQKPGAARIPASTLCRIFAPVPQVLQNVRYKNAVIVNSDELRDAVTAAEQRLGNTGRILVRKSGTEPLIRVMAEGDDAALVRSEVAGLCDLVARMDAAAGA
jgi:phosphoglucosamine mutase